MAFLNEKKINGLLSSKRYKEAAEKLSLCRPQEVAEFLSKRHSPESAIIFRFLTRDFSADVFSYMKTRQQNSLLKNLGCSKTKEILSSLGPDDRTELFEELPAHITKKLMDLLSKEDLAEAKKLLGYPISSVGREMTPEYVSLKPEWSIRKAVSHLRKVAKKSETINVLYVVDNNNLLMGYLTIKNLILSNPKKTIRDVMERPICISAFSDREEAAKMIKKYDLIALPVIDSKGIMLGIVTVDDLIDISEEEATEDFYKFGGISQDEAETPQINDVLNSSVAFLYKKRIGWLLLLLFVSLFSSAILAHYEGLIESVVVLVFFLPLLIGSGGNTGSQSATIMIRSLATGDIKLSDWFPLIKRELIVALALGITMGIGVFILGMTRGGMNIAIIVFMTMVCTIFVSSLIGMSLPFILSKLNKDPAMASAPLISSISDIIGITIYFSIAKVVLGI